MLKFEDFTQNPFSHLPDVATQKVITFNKTVVYIVSDKFTEELEAVDNDQAEIINRTAEIKDFKCKKGEILTVTPAGKSDIIIIASVGDLQKDLTKTSLNNLGGKVNDTLNALKQEEVAIINLTKIVESDTANIAYGLLTKNYRFDTFYSAKKEGKGSHLRKINIEGADSLEKKIQEKYEIAKHVYIARELVNYPAQDLNPESYATIIETSFKQRIFKDLVKSKKVKVHVLGEEEMEELGMNSLLAVGRAGFRESKLVVVEYHGNSRSNKMDLALVGKGVCFDTGGLSLKPAQYMEDMKTDMGGSAAAFASLKLIAKSGLDINAVCVVGLVENCIDGSAYKPGDVLKSMSGQTIEVLNTDAEGRLVLADALYYCQKNYEPTYTVDLATLTGAVTIALADIYAGLCSDDDDIKALLKESADKTGERIWELPMGEEFDEMINSKVADMQNIGNGRGAGTITAAQFLKRFVNCDDKIAKTKWAHLDIAGTAYAGKYALSPITPKGATGFGIELLFDLAKKLSEQ